MVMVTLNLSLVVMGNISRFQTRLPNTAPADFLFRRVSSHLSLSEGDNPVGTPRANDQ